MSNEGRCKAPAALLLALLLAVTAPLSAKADMVFPDQEDAVESAAAVEEDQGEEDQDQDEAAVEEEAPAVSMDPRVALLNGAAGNSRSPSSGALDALLDDLLDELVDDSMDTYTQVKVCYDYLVQNMTYGSHMRNLGAKVGDGVTCRDIYYSYGELEGFGAVALTANTGMCNAYSSGFILLTRKLGLDSYLVKGYTRNGYGGYTYHEWAEMRIDGKVYLFDPQVEQSLSRYGMPAYSVFCKTYDQVPGRYSK